MEGNDEKEDEEIVIRCPSCGVQNKRRTLRVEQSSRCGKCGAVLIEMREFGKSSE
jgi:predicted Zn-ribbon and HTH transcriptional regulator